MDSSALLEDSSLEELSTELSDELSLEELLSAEEVEELEELLSLEAVELVEDELLLDVSDEPLLEESPLQAVSVSAAASTAAITIIFFFIFSYLSFVRPFGTGLFSSLCYLAFLIAASMSLPS